MSQPPERRRHPWGTRLDRLLTPLLALGGRLLARPDEGLLHALTGRTKGGPASGGDSPLLAGRRALSEGQLGEALLCFARAAEQDPGDPWPWHGRGDALQLSGQYQDALDAYREALSRAPELALSHCGLGNALEGLGRIEQARAAWERALALDPELPWARDGLARTGGGG